MANAVQLGSYNERAPFHRGINANSRCRPYFRMGRDCNEVRAEIDAKITAKGVTGYVLEVVDLRM